MSNPKQDPSNQAEPDLRASPVVDKAVAKKVWDEIGDACVNDWLEVAIVITMLIAMSGGAYMLYLLYQLNQVTA